MSDNAMTISSRIIEQKSKLILGNPYQTIKSKLQYQSLYNLSIAVNSIVNRKIVFNDKIEQPIFQIKV